MKRAAMWMGAMLAVIATYRIAAAEPRIDPTLEATVRKFNEAFNRFEPEAVAAFWAENGTVLTPVGTWGEGRAGVAKAYGQDATTVLKGSMSTFTIRKARELGKDTLFLDLDQDVQGMHRPDGSTGPAKLHLVLLANRNGGQWRWLDARPYAFLQRPGGPPASGAQPPGRAPTK